MSVMQPINQRVMSFAEVVHGRDASVRITHDKLLHALDLVMVMTGKSKIMGKKTTYLSFKF